MSWACIDIKFNFLHYYFAKISNKFHWNFVLIQKSSINLQFNIHGLIFLYIIVKSESKWKTPKHKNCNFYVQKIQSSKMVIKVVFLGVIKIDLKFDLNFVLVFFVWNKENWWYDSFLSNDWNNNKKQYKMVSIAIYEDLRWNLTKKNQVDYIRVYSNLIWSPKLIIKH